MMINTRAIAAVLAFLLALPGPSFAASVARIQVSGSPILPIGAAAMAAAAPGQLAGPLLQASLGKASLQSMAAVPTVVPVQGSIRSVISAVPAAQAASLALAAPAAAAPMAQAAPQSLAESMPAGPVRQAVTALSEAVSDPKTVAKTLDRVFENSSQAKDSDEMGPLGGEESAAALSPEASAMYREYEAAAAKRMAAYEAEVGRVRSGRFGLIVQYGFDEQGRLQAGAGFTLDNQPMSQAQLLQALRSGRVTPAQWSRAEKELGGAVQGLLQKLVSVLRQNDAERREVQLRMDALVQGTYRSIPNPAYSDSDQAPPPHLSQAHVQGLLDMVKALPGTPVQKDVMRLMGNLVRIDRSWVDPIPASSWDKAVELMGEVAKKVYDSVKPNWSDTVTAMIKAAAEKLLDPFSVYWTADEYKAFVDLEHNTFVGIGVIFEESGSAVIDTVIPGGPAEKAGLKSGDKITAVDGKPAATAEERIKAIRGQKGTPVRISVERGGQPQDITVTRGQVVTRNVYSKMAAPGVGYIYLGQFSPDCEKEIFAAVLSLREQGARKLVLDLRNNPGGSVDSVSSIVASFFKDGQKIVAFKKQGTEMYRNVAAGDGRFQDMPLVVLVNGNSASASELLAGAIQDVRGAVIVGSRSYGKGSMQTIMPDAQGRALKLTIGRWYTPNDRNIDNQRVPETKEKIKGTGGIVPDHAVDMTEDQEKAVLRQLLREVGGGSPQGPRVADPVLEKAMELLAARP
ncbi:MAG: S41 family peptidase [Elusimicrobia bacterium]|nr:S41 family peptidase [Elusimicrobiota bacterium]